MNIFRGTGGGTVCDFDPLPLGQNDGTEVRETSGPGRGRP